ncbi:MAG: hypothetical protein QMD77_03585 [Patescibacteria group bacterium]|nr:hypothetical protein [Patescibacteria group bacterium]
MKRRNKTTKEKKYASGDSRGAVRSDRLLVAGLAVIIVVSTVIIGSVLHSWKKQWMGGKKWSRDTNVENLQAQVNALKKQVGELKIKEDNPATQGSEGSLAANQTSSAFENAVNQEDFAKAETLLADNVYYVIDASDCCGDISKKEAVQNFKNYIKSVKSFDFDQEQQVVKQMKVNLAETFSKYTIGIADNKMVLSYQVNKRGKINNIMLSASHLMYDLE